MRFTLLFLTFLLMTMPAHPFQIISYNVENLFDHEPDTAGGKSIFEAPDFEYTFEGDRHWTYSRYQQKLNHISQVIANIGEWNTPALIGLLEVENHRCVHDLATYKLRNYGYKYLHQESPDQRGIDCALLYDPKQFILLDSAFIEIPIPNHPTREIIYAKGQLGRNATDTLHVFVCHLPSKGAGTDITQKRRNLAFSMLQKAINKILKENARANIVVMGDMNQEPEDNLKGVTNRMIDLKTNPPGSHKWNGVWDFLDQFYTAGYLLEDANIQVFAPDWLLEEDTKYAGLRPIRTYQGYRYQKDGYSDHLPIILTF